MSRTAFSHWLERESGGNTLIASEIIFNMLMQNRSRDNLVWGLLERTGDKPYTSGTFLKAAQLALTNDLPEDGEEQDE